MTVGIKEDWMTLSQNSILQKMKRRFSVSPRSTYFVFSMEVEHWLGNIVRLSARELFLLQVLVSHILLFLIILTIFRPQYFLLPPLLSYFSLSLPLTYLTLSSTLLHFSSYLSVSELYRSDLYRIWEKSDNKGSWSWCDTIPYSTWLALWVQERSTWGSHHGAPLAHSLQSEGRGWRERYEGINNDIDWMYHSLRLISVRNLFWKLAEDFFSASLSPSLFVSLSLSTALFLFLLLLLLPFL